LSPFYYNSYPPSNTHPYNYYYPPISLSPKFVKGCAYPKPKSSLTLGSASRMPDQSGRSTGLTNSCRGAKICYMLTKISSMPYLRTPWGSATLTFKDLVHGTGVGKDGYMMLPTKLRSIHHALSARFTYDSSRTRGPAISKLTRIVVHS